MLNIPKNGSVSDTLAESLENAIAHGEYPVGTSLPSERELLARFGVSRATVREALRQLSARGLIEVRRGRKGGSYISRPSPHGMVQALNLFIKGQDIRFIDLVYAREAIEPAAAAQAAICRTAEQLKALRLLCLKCEESLGDVERFVEVNVEWHLAVAEASGNSLFITFLTSISDALRTATDLDEFDVPTRKAVIGVHWQIFEAIRIGDSVAARRRMERHLSAYRDQLSTIDLAQKMRR